MSQLLRSHPLLPVLRQPHSLPSPRLIPDAATGKLVGALLISGRGPSSFSASSYSYGGGGAIVCFHVPLLRFRCVHGNIPHLHLNVRPSLFANSPKNRELWSQIPVLPGETLLRSPPPPPLLLSYLALCSHRTRFRGNFWYDIDDLILFFFFFL